MRTACCLALMLSFWADAAAQAPEVGYPGGGRARLPLPGRKARPKQHKEPLLVYRGIVQTRNADKLVLSTPDGLELGFACTRDTMYFRKDQEIEPKTVEPGMKVMVEARQNQEAFLFAENVVVEDEAGPEPGKESAPAPAARPAAKPEARRREPGDPGPPVLRRGRPQRPPRAETQTAGAATGDPATADPPVEAAESEPEPEDPHIVKARGVVSEFTETLPNYVVQQITTRYWSETSKPDWKALDILSADVVYENGKESYRNLRINNKPVNKPLEKVGGSVSHGEFGTTMRDVFSTSSNARFTRMGTSEFGGRKAWKYDFHVERANSHWLTRFGSHSIRPAYHGTVWLDPATTRVLRIEMQARSIPDDYPLDVIEWVVEYGEVRIGGKQFLVPVHAEVLACLRGTARCSRNATDYRNYRRFTAESQVYATESTIDFDQEVPMPPKKP